MVGKKTRMFKFIRKTWNPVVGCLHHCYNERCWANLTAGRLRHIDRYKDGFNKPKLIEAELKKRFGKGQLVFVTDMGDLFGQWVPDEWILKVIEAMKNSPEAKFFLETKNPRRYFDFLERLPHNVILSTTIETNRDYRLSKAPPPRERYEAMKELLWHEKHVSVEPVADFDLDVFVSWIHDIGPQRVSVGYDNYNAGFREPSLSKTLKLIDKLEEFTDVERKTLREANTVSKRDIKAKLEEIVKDSHQRKKNGSMSGPLSSLKPYEEYRRKNLNSVLYCQ